MFSVIPNIKNRKVINEFSNLQELVDYIKSNKRAEIEYIHQARSFGKGSNEYNKIKKNKLPCVIINFRHIGGYIKGSTVSEPTGFLFLDVDDSFIGNIDFNYVCAYWKSLSNKGFSIIVKVNGLNKENLKESYRHVGNLLDLNYDKSAISIDRLTVLSYDPNANINDNAIPIDLPEKETHFNRIKILNNDYDRNGSKIRYDDFESQLNNHIDEIEYDEDGIYDFGEQKLLYHKAYIPFYNIKKGSRNKRMSSFIHQIICLNKNFDSTKLLTFFYKINQDKFSPPLTNKRIKEIFYSKYNSKEELVPIVNATRRFVYNPDYSFTTKQKRALNAKRIGKDKIRKSKGKIRNCLLNWNHKSLGKITNKKVSSVTGLNIKTVNNYCKDVKFELGII